MDHRVRLAAFEFLRELERRKGNPLAFSDLTKGFEFEGSRVPLLGPQGIFKPAVLPAIPLSITTAPAKPGRLRPYDDTLGTDGKIAYRYRGSDPAHRDNAGLRAAMRNQTPLVYFFGLTPGFYEAAYPAYVVGDDPGSLTFTIAVDDRTVTRDVSDGVAESDSAGRRAYITTLTLRRLHQSSFRERVIAAYRRCCAICRLRHAELLDAAHILPDKHPGGEPHVSNGLALCKIHHAAFDRHILGVRPDLIIEIRGDILREEDGPMLRHGLQALHGNPLAVIPRSLEHRPKRSYLEERYALFRDAS